MGPPCSFSKCSLSDAVANRCNAITLFAGEYLLAVDGDFTRQLEDAERVCKDYAKRRDVVRVAQAKLADELKKRGQYEKMLDPRKGLSKEELAARDARNDRELGSLRSMMETYEYKPSK